jgi:hypothetical protein
MTTAPMIELRFFKQLAPARDDLIAVYSDVRAELLHLPNYAVPAFTERLDRHANAPGWAAVLAYTDDGEAVGYARRRTETGRRGRSAALRVTPQREGREAAVGRHQHAGGEVRQQAAGQGPFTGRSGCDSLPPAVVGLVPGSARRR